MRHDVKLMVAALVVLCVATACQKKSKEVADEEAFSPTWASLSRHEAVPEWIRDAKFGIYCHWGVYSVPAYGNEQYYHYMHLNDSSDHFLMGLHRQHVARFGPLEQFGYHDFIPMFKAEKFDAEEWAALFQRFGARFAGIVAEHHDGFSMWDSKYTPFCAAKMGPERDVLGELSRAIRGRGMKVFASLHHEINYTYAKIQPGWAAYNRKYRKLYGCLMPREEWLQMWLDKATEVAEKYSPDIIYFDAWMDSIPESYKLQFLANYFNHARQTGQEVIFTYKYKEFPRSIGMLDHEMASLNEIDTIPWLCDFCISDGYHKAWGYVNGQQYLTSKAIIHRLIDVVANNGQLLMNMSPRADGTFPQEQLDVMDNVGVWLWSYGEAIYATRPYAVSGETAVCKGGQAAAGQDVAPDRCPIRYTRSKDGKTLYAIMLDWPGKGAELQLKEVIPSRLNGQIRKATLLSVKRNYDCTFSQEADGLSVKLAGNARMPSDAAGVIRLDL